MSNASVDPKSSQAHADAHDGHEHDHGDGHDHGGHDHGDGHVPSITSENQRKVLLAFCLIFGFMIVEVIGGILSGSLALLADAGHMVTDAAALALSYAAFRFGRRAADSKRTFGYLRLEVVAGLVNAITLFAIVGWIAFEAWERFQTPQPILAGPMFGVAAAGLVVNVVVLWILTRGDSEHVNIKGAALHVMGDLLGSVGAVGAAIVVSFTGWTPIDPILSVLVSLLILRSTWKLLSKSLHILLEGAPDNAAPGKIERRLLETIPGLAAVSHIHVWSLTSGRTLATLKVRPRRGEEVRLVVRAVEHELKSHFKIEHPTVSLTWDDEDESCSLSIDAANAKPAHDEKKHSGTHCH